ncbi:helix-turn-helix transcriptional regulator [Phycicoccus endophyticus]|uniref:Helix-turn-helix transcriptional regulator n=1 Tax=Phycicoccus endophyticus TaxID=1690220 RepID=A0A7G9QZM2_9MICO|nr:helix-turn-helix transcriptional regulator [Phycicoccus endophyticus]NHI19985.1 helix-turn-helix transcriptional regulator [Phycicoccus endophyticus]QNN48797.1 helix-turn-helix transcriptional regulator [Phycicoccus endophyticus]GGL42832.1 transcriptional regulator [Phycicoccus endophyticus]
MDNDIRRLRTERGLSQAALGQALGVSRQTVNSLEAGRYDPSLPLAILLARYFDTTVESLFHLPGGRTGRHG